MQYSIEPRTRKYVKDMVFCNLQEIEKTVIGHRTICSKKLLQ